MKNGTLSSSGKKFTAEEIADIQGTKQFRDRYGKYLRKSMRPPQTMIQLLDDWFVKYKVTASDGERPAKGRLDPVHQVPLFTQETKQAVENCKEKAVHLTDPFPLEDMYFKILPNPNPPINTAKTAAEAVVLAPKNKRN